MTQGIIAKRNLQDTPAPQISFNDLQCVLKRTPKSVADTSSNVLAKPSRANRIAIAPYAAAITLFEIMRATQSFAASKRIIADFIEMGIDRRLPKPQGRNADSFGDPLFDRVPPNLCGRVALLQYPPDEEIVQVRYVGAALCYRIEKIAPRRRLLDGTGRTHGACVTRRQTFARYWPAEKLCGPLGI